MTECSNLSPQNPQGTDLSTSIPSISFMLQQPTLKSLSLFVKLFLFRSFEELCSPNPQISVYFPRSDRILLWSKTMGLLLLPLLYTCFMDWFGWRWKDFDKLTQLEMVRRLRHCWL